MEQVAAATAVNDNDLKNAFPRHEMLRPVKSAESLSNTASTNHPQRTQSDRLGCTASKPGVASTLLSSGNKSLNVDCSKNHNDTSAERCSEITKELPKRNTNVTDPIRAPKSLANDSGSRPLSVELDEVGELEKVSQAVVNLKNSIISNSRTNSPKCHSRSSSHESYFDRKLASSVVQFQMDDDSESGFIESPEKQRGSTKHFDNASLDLSEIQVNFELEENEMKIFSEDEAMLSNSCGSDLSKSLFGNSIFDDEPHSGNAKYARNSTKPLSSGTNEECLTSPKNRRMSFREKFKIFTSPNSGRKTETAEGNETQQCTNGKSESSSIIASKKSSIKDKVLGTLSPESLRKRNNILGTTHLPQCENQQQLTVNTQMSPMKKKSSSFSPGTSPNNTTNLVKRSKIENAYEGNKESDKNDSSFPCNDAYGAQNDHVPCGIPLSPSIQFMDESTESTSKCIANSGK